MRVRVDFHINKDIDFYTPLTEAMTAFIYRMIRWVDPKYGSKLHEDGHATLGYKKFVYHSYSLAQNNQHIQCSVKRGLASIIFSSALEDTTINLVKGITRLGKIQLFGYSFNILGIQYIPEPQIGPSAVFRALSPICALGTGYKWLNVEQTEKKVADNLIEKYYAMHNNLPHNTDIKIKLLSPKTEYMRYKKMKYRGYMGTAIMEGDKELIKLAHKAGLGPKCGIGMGLLEKM